MNRRSFFKFLGIGAATAVVAPKLLLAEPKRRGWWTNRTTPTLLRQRFESLLPDEVKISDENWKFLKYLRDKELSQLGVNDIQALQRMKRNG